jgi:uncharacterized protein (TIGR02001 family)
VINCVEFIDKAVGRNGLILRMTRLEKRFRVWSLCAIAMLAQVAVAGQVDWGGSIGVTTDYLVRGISRSNHEASLQAEAHVAGRSGWLAGLFTSSTQFAPGGKRDAELGAFIGYARALNDDWSTKFTVSHYAYPWNDAGAAYDYNEFNADLTYRGWLSLGVLYSPDAPRYNPYYGLFGVRATSVEINLQSPAWNRLSFNAGIGHSQYAGKDGAGFAYWSAGCSYDLAPLAVSLGFVDSGAAAGRLFYESAARRRWVAALIWRF